MEKRKGGGPRAGGLARRAMALLVAAAAALGCAQPAQAASVGDTVHVDGEYRNGYLTESHYYSCKVDAVSTPSGTHDVYCVELGVASQVGDRTMTSLEGSTTRNVLAGTGPHTWMADEVTEAALIRQYIMDRQGYTDLARANVQVCLWTYTFYGWDLGALTSMAGQPGYWAAYAAQQGVDLADLVNWVRANKDAYVGRGYLFGTGATEGDQQQASAMLWAEPARGRARVRKASADEGMTAGNPCYSLEGARFGVYASANDAAARSNAVAELTTGADGYTGYAELAPGTYWVRESSAPKGYRLNENWASVTVTAGADSEVTLADEPKEDPFGIYVKKQDAAGREEAQGDADLAGAEFTVRFYEVDPAGVGKASDLDGKTPARTWVVRTKKASAGGWYYAKLSDACKVSGDGWYGYDAGQDNATAPLGVMTVEETRAPEGYVAAEGTLVAKVVDDLKIEYIREGGWADGTVVGQIPEAGASVALNERAVAAGKVVGLKVDAERDEAVAQGDATLAGAAVTLYNRSASDVAYGGKTAAPGEAVAPAATAEDGSYEFPAGLPYGTYEVRETKASKGYRLNEGWSASFEVREDGAEISLAGASRLKESVERGGVGVAKVDAQRDEAVAEGAATLAGAEITVANRSARAVLVGGVPYEPGSAVAVITTDAQGVAKTGEAELPYGTYELTETKASKGYKLNSGWKATLEVREDGKIAWADAHGEGGHLEEQVIRGDFSFDKVEGFSQAEMAGVPFLVTSRATGESHVVVTDANGQVDTASSFTRHSQDTNASDAALNADRTAIADESKLVCDGSAGVWFNGYADHETEPDDSLGALPYDTYDVTELAVKANAGHNLVSFTVTVTRDGVDIDKGTKEDSEVNIATTLGFDGGKDAPADSTVTLTDEVQFENVKRGGHTMTASVHVVNDDGADGGEVARATKSFTNGVTTGSVTVEIEVDTTGLAGRKLVCLEYLDLNEDGSSTAKHEDLADEAQTVTVPKISTSAAGSADDEALAESGCVLTDTVSYKGLTPGKTYTLTATLHQRGEEGEDLGAVLGADGQAVTATKTFSPATPDGSVDVDVEVDASALAGRTVVFFEDLTRGGLVFATHADISDEGQDVHFPGVETHASDKESGEQAAEAKEKVTIRDAVSYTNLTVGRTYKVKGALHLQETGEDGTVSDGGVLTDAEGNTYTAEAEFTAEAAGGTVDLEFEVDASALAGRTVVCFEDLIRQGVTVGTHADITDEGQSVSFPKIGTTLTDADGKHETQAKADEAGKRVAELTDVVSYENLEPGRTYRVEGTLHRRAADGSDAGEVAGATASAEFTPATSDGTVEVKFTLDAGLLGDGEAVVAFERVSLKGATDEDGSVVVARHEDISDEGQTVTIVDVHTTATDAADGDHTLAYGKQATVTDKVSYTGLTPGKEYKVAGTLHVKGEGGVDAGELTDADGRAVTAEATFVPEASDGSVDVTFTFDTSDLGGESLVAFEELSRDGIGIAWHADITDEDQTVTVEVPPTPEEPETPGSPSTPGESLPQTGVSIAALVLTIGGAAAAAAAGGKLAWDRRRAAGDDAREGGEEE